jgi:16S rRNA (cytidine1402-2'-O)-methyltransferase
LTKRFETIVPTTISEAVVKYENEDPRGEFVLVIEGKSLAEQKSERQEEYRKRPIEEQMRFYEEQGIGRKEAMKRVAADRGVSKREIYAYLLEHPAESENL